MKAERVTYNSIIPCKIVKGVLKGKNKHQTEVIQLMCGNGNYPVEVNGKLVYYVNNNDIVGTTKKPKGL